VVHRGDFKKSRFQEVIFGKGEVNDTEGAVEGNSGYWRLLKETFMGETLCPAHAINSW